MFWPTVARNSTEFFRSCLPCVAAWASCFRTYSRLPSTTISSIRAFVRPIWTTFPNSIIALSTIRPFCTTGSTDFRVGSACLMVFRNLAVITMTSAFVYVCVCVCLSVTRITRSLRRILMKFLEGEMCGSVAEWLGSRTCDQQVAGSNPGRRGAKCNPGQVVYTHTCLCHQAV